MEENRFDRRITFSKYDRAVFISHLDLMRTMQRAFKRADLPIWYTQGFNPHAYIMFPLALSLGISSDVEIMDASLTEDIPCDEVTKRLNSALPTGLKIIKTALPVNKHTAIKKAEYEIILNAAQRDFNEFISREKIEIKKKSKKNYEKLIDIKPDIELLGINAKDEEISICVRLPAGCDLNINPSVLIEAFSEFTGKVYTAKISRTRILDNNGEEYR